MRLVKGVLVLVLMTGVLLTGQWGWGKEEAAATTQPSATEVRVYDVSDLLRASFDYPLPAALAPQHGGGGGGKPSMPGAAPQATPGRPLVAVDALLKMVQSMVQPDSWKDNGGTVGSIYQSGSVLVIAQTPGAHAEIAQLLERIRNEQGPATMVCIRAYWLTLDPQEVAAVFAPRRAGAAGNGNPVAPMPEVKDEVFDKSHLYCQAQTICFNGQTVHVQSGREWNYVSDITPVVGTNAVGYDPQIGTARSGVQLQVTPQLVPNSAALVLDIRSTVNETKEVTPAMVPMVLRDPSTQPAAGMPGPAMSVLNMVAQSFATTLRLPLGRKVLVGGMTLEPAAKAEASRQLYLVIEADAVR